MNDSAQGLEDLTGRLLVDTPAPRHVTPFRREAPNVLVIVMDDLGFAQLGCYGSNIDTPNIDALAARGVRFTNYHTTAMCSPTRACMLTGRNHHRVGMGMLPDLPLGFPGYTGEIPSSAGTLAEILRANGWATFCVGKWHLVPRDQRATGPFHNWPTGLGFERYYGFLNGETNQWTPNLVRDQQHIEQPATPEEGYHLDADLADQAIAYIREHRLNNVDRPFFMWYATGAPHAPHQAPPEWIDRYRGRFDGGWDSWRADVLARQHALGVIDAAVDVSPRPDWVAAWEKLDDDQRRLYARMMEVFAGFLSHADHHIGRLIGNLERTGELDNTIVVFASDNGCSAEGGPNGSWNQLRHYISEEPDNLAEELARFDDLGGVRSSGHYPWGWALAGNSPFRRWKRYTYEGGIRDPLIVVRPGAPAGEAGTLRHQWCHATDIAPTILDLLELVPPGLLNNVEQMSFDGSSFATILDDPTVPATHTHQYFELWGSRAMYADGYKAVTDHVNQLTAAERDKMLGSHRFADDKWQLFDTRRDPAEVDDLAEAEPERLAALVDLWHSEAARNLVYPLDDSRMNRAMKLHVPWSSFRPVHRFRPGDKVHELTAPMMWGGFAMTSVFSSPLGVTASGTVCEQGDWISGWAWLLNEGSVTWVQHVDGVVERVDAVIPPTSTVLRAWTSPIEGGGFLVSLAADDELLATGPITSIPLTWSPDGAFLTVGYSRPFPVIDDYTPPFPAPSTLVSVSMTVGPPPPFDLAAEIESAMRHQ